MRQLLVNVLLALAWAAVTGDFAPGNLLAGFLLGWVVIMLAEPVSFPGGYGSRIARAVLFVILYLWALVLSNLRVLYDVVTHKEHARPAVLAIPLHETHTDGELTMLANLVTFTPGTLSLDVSPDKRYLYVHAMFAADPEAVRREIEALERRVMGVVQ